MKIAIMIPTIYMGGAERVAVSMANWLVNNNNAEVHLISFSNLKAKYTIDSKVKVYYKDNNGKNKNKISRFIKKIISEKKYALGILETVRPDVIFAMLYEPTIYARLYKRKNKNVKIIASERTNPKIKRKNMYINLLKKIEPYLCDGYIFQTERVKEMYSKKIQNRSVVIANAVSNPYLSEINQELKKEHIITNMGRLTRQKGQDVLIKAFAKVVNEHPQYKLEIYGDGEDKSMLEKITGELNLKDKVFFMGNNPKAILEIAKSELFVLSSRWEGMPNALLEAMASGTACISTDCIAGPAEIITNNENGILVPVDDVNELANKMIYLINNKAVREKMAEEAKEVREKYSIDSIFSKYYDFFYKMKDKPNKTNAIIGEIFLKCRRRRLTNIIPTKLYLSLVYKYKIGRKIYWDNVETFNEKLQWLKLNNKNPNYIKMVDKYEVKKYIADLIGEEYIIPTLGVYNRFKDIDFEKLPNQFVIKCTHDSGGVFVCKDKNQIDKKQAMIKIEESLHRNYYYRSREWSYKNIKPRIIVEKYLEDVNCENLMDYKLFCFNGKAKMILVCSNRSGNQKNTDFYDTDWNLLPFTREKHVNNPNGIKRPENLSEMVQIAEKLSHKIPFVRVDLYEIEGRIYFGELTFYPSGGFEGFLPKEYDKVLGDMLELPI